MDFAFNHGSQLIGSACNNLLHKLLQMQRPWERATVLCSSDAPAQAGLHTGILHHDSGAWHRRLTTTPLFGLRLLMHAVDWIAVTQSPWLMVFMASSVFQFQLLCSLSLDRANWNNWLSIALLRTSARLSTMGNTVHASHWLSTMGRLTTLVLHKVAKNAGILFL